ncbi:MAG: universal stress protein [Actinomycetes bacterium]
MGLPHLHSSPEDIARTRRRVQEVVDAAVSRNEAVKAVDVRLHVVDGIPVEVLREEAGADDHLVLGSRGHRELRALFLGSVSHDLVHSARCPVTVVRSPMAQPPA